MQPICLLLFHHKILFALFSLQQFIHIPYNNSDVYAGEILSSLFIFIIHNHNILLLKGEKYIRKKSKRVVIEYNMACGMRSDESWSSTFFSFIFMLAVKLDSTHLSHLKCIYARAFLYNNIEILRLSSSTFNSKQVRALLHSS